MHSQRPVVHRCLRNPQASPNNLKLNPSRAHRIYSLQVLMPWINPARFWAIPLDTARPGALPTKASHKYRPTHTITPARCLTERGSSLLTGWLVATSLLYLPHTSQLWGDRSAAMDAWSTFVVSFLPCVFDLLICRGSAGYSSARLMANFSSISEGDSPGITRACLQKAHRCVHLNHEVADDEPLA